MSERTTIQGIVKSVADGQTWYGPSVSDIVKDITPETARTRSVANTHSIWEIAAHMVAWQEYNLRVMNGGDSAFLDDAHDWPDVEGHTDTDWEASIEQLAADSRLIAEKLDSWDDEKLRETVRGRDFPFKVLLHGIAQHNIYHSGQIALLKKATGPIA
ncbi:MAG: DinB family protein [Candidatus Hydrogenedentota bacterium]